MSNCQSGTVLDSTYSCLYKTNLAWVFSLLLDGWTLISNSVASVAAFSLAYSCISVLWSLYKTQTCFGFR